MPPLNSFTKTSIALALSQTITLPVQAATLTVNSLADDLTPNNAQCTLREAIVSVNNRVLNTDCGSIAPGVDDAIVFAPTISATDTISLTNGYLQISKDVSITAPDKVFNPPFSNDRLTIHQTTVDSGVLKFTDNTYSQQTVSIHNLVISGGNSYFGGGVYAFASTNLTIDDCVIQSNTARFAGGIFAGLGSTLNVTNSVIQGNSATTFGGGAYISEESSITISDSFFGSNYSSSSGGALLATRGSTVTINSSSLEFNSASTYGGCIAGTTNSTITLNDAYLSRCYASTFGGGVSLLDSSLSMNDSSISYSRAGGTNYNDGGGGIDARAASTVSINDSSLSRNYSSNDGAAMDVFEPATAVINRSSLTYNSAERLGGAVYSTGTLTLNSSTVFSNSADRGAGLFANNGGVVNINNSTVLSNSANSFGGGVEVYVSSSANFTNSIISFNTGLSAREVSKLSSANISVAGVNVFGTSKYNFAESFNNFTPTLTNIVATSDGNQPTSVVDIFAGGFEIAPNGTLFFPLANGSPAIGVASTAGCPARDQRDIDREDSLIVTVVAANDKVAVVDLGGECDVGAVEFSKELVQSID